MEARRSTAISFSVLASSSEELVTFLLPERLGVGSNAVQKSRLLMGVPRSISIASDVMIIRDLTNDPVSGWAETVRLANDSVRGWVETVRLASDFNLIWARFDSEDAHTPEELILIDGHTLELEGRTLLRSTKKINHLVARRVGDRFRVETDEGVLEIGLPVTDLEALFAKLNQGSGVPSSD